MAKKQISMEEFKEKVVERLKEEYAPRKDEEFLRQCVNDEYFADIINDGYNRRHGSKFGVEYAAENISMCI